MASIEKEKLDEAVKIFSAGQNGCHYGKGSTPVKE